MMAQKRRDDNCPIQAPIGCRKLSEDDKVRFSVVPDGWNSSSSGDQEKAVVKPIKRKRSLQPKMTSRMKHKKKCVSRQ